MTDAPKSVYGGRPISRRQFLGGMSAVTAAGLVARPGVLGLLSPVPEKGSLIPVNLSTGLTVETSNFFVAEKMGYFADHRVRANLKAFLIPVDGADAMLAGTENVAQLVQLPFLNFLANGADLIIVANTCTSRNVSLVTKSSISTVDQLAGTKIGFPFNTGQQYAFAAYLQYVKLSASSVTTVNVDNSDLVAALAAGSIDGFLGIQPQVSQAVKDVGGTHVFAHPPAGDAYQSPEYLVLERTWANLHGTAVEGIIAGLVDASTYIPSHKRETARIMAPQLDLPVSQVQTLLGPNPAGDGDDFTISLNVDEIASSLESVARWMVQAGLIKAIPDYRSAIDSRFIRRVAPSAVSG